MATLTHRLSNARMEAANTTIRPIARRAFGFKSAQALIALAVLTLGGLCPPLPGRSLTYLTHGNDRSAGKGTVRCP